MTLTVADTWICVRCRAPIPFTDDSCTACGWSLRPVGDTDTATAGATGKLMGGRRSRLWIAALQELVLVNLLFIVWRIVGNHSLLDSSGATTRGRALWNAERWLHLPSEHSVQQLVVTHPVLMRICDEFYAWAHIGVMVGVLAWLWARHRDRYAGWRNVLVRFTFVALLIGWLPIAPPRLLPGIGMVDTAMRDHTSVYAGLGKGVTDQLSAMPSIHVGWALLAALIVIAVSASRWRWLALFYPAATCFVVIATANHYWLDGIAAAALLAAVLAASALLRKVKLPRGFRDRTAQGRIDGEGVSQLVDGKAVLHRH